MKTDTITIDIGVAEEVARHILATLPDSISARIATLSNVIHLLPQDHEIRLFATDQLQIIQKHQRAQIEFSISYQTDGHHKPKGKV